jgi:hypothetical protein
MRDRKATGTFREQSAYAVRRERARLLGLKGFGGRVGGAVWKVPETGRSAES